MLELNEQQAQKIADKQDNTYGEPKKITSQVKEVIDTLDPMGITYEQDYNQQPWSKELKKLNSKYKKAQEEIKQLKEENEMKTKQVKFLQAKCREK